MGALGKAAGAVRETVAAGGEAANNALGLKEKYAKTKKAVAGAADSIDGKLCVSEKFHKVTSACDKQLQRFGINDAAISANQKLAATGAAMDSAVSEKMSVLANSSKDFR